MATVIDSLVVSLGLDTKNFTKGQKESVAQLKEIEKQSNKTKKSMESDGKAVAQAFSSVKKELLAVYAIYKSFSSVKGFIENTILSTSALGRMSENLGIAKKDLAEWQLANKHAGGSIEGITSALQGANKEIADFQNGREAFNSDRYYQVNLSNIRSGTDLLMARADTLKRLRDEHGEGYAMNAAAEMHIDASTYNLLKQGSTAVREQMQAQAKLAEAQASTADAAERLRRIFDDLANKAQVVGIKLLNIFLPALERFSSYLDRPEFQHDLDAFIKGVTDLANAVVKALRVLGIIDKEKPSNSNVIDLGFATYDTTAAKAADAKLNPQSSNGFLYSAKDLKSKLGFNPAQKYNDASLNEYATSVEKKLGLPPGAINVIKNQGEKSNSNQVSPKGAAGVMQTMPAIFKQYGKGDPSDPYASIDAGGLYLKDLLKQYNGNFDAVAAHYNGGTSQGRQVLNGQRPSKPETASYLDRIRAARYGNGASKDTGNSSTSETNINGPINIHTQATDSAGIASSLGAELSKYGYVPQANTGLN